MAGRDRYLRPPAVSSSSLRIGEQQLARSDPNRTRSSVLLEDRIEIQHREIQSLLVNNQQLAVEHIALEKEITTDKRNRQRLLETAAKVKSERDAQVREVYQKSLKMEAEVRVINVLGAELDQVQGDVKRLADSRQELAAELAAVDADIAKVKSNSQRASEIKAEIETLRREIHIGRAALETEKKTRASNRHHKRVMEKTMGLLNHEIVKLREELANAESKVRTAAAAAPTSDPGFAASYGNPDFFGGNPYPEAYDAHQVYGTSDHLP